MKHASLSILAFLIFAFSYAQQPEKKYFIVFFKDKGITNDVALKAGSYLSQKSVNRRVKSNIAFTISDLPVNEQYIQSLSNSGARVISRSRWFNNAVIETDTEIADLIAEMPFVSIIQPVSVAAASTEISEKPYFRNETLTAVSPGIYKKTNSDLYNYGSAYNQIAQMNGQFLHNNGYSGQGMTIAVIDAGFNSVDVMDCFDSLRANNQILGTRDFAEPGNNVYAQTMHTHGTSVLSCMAANISGVMVGTAPKADYWLLRSEVGATETVIEEYYWVSAAEFADSVGVDLINSSLGYTQFDDPLTNHTYADMDGNTTVVTIGADMAAQKGILVVNSAGNSGGDAWRYIGAPADGDSVFTIGAVDASGNRVGFSSVGPTYDGRIKPTVSAQGSGAAVFSPSGLNYGNGTSFSSPITCGITACLWQALPELSNMELIELIKLTASQASQPDSLLGWGIPNMEKAFTSLSVGIKKDLPKLSTYPNPVTNQITLSLATRVDGIATVQILNLQGQLIYSKIHEITSGSILISNLSDLSSGIYFLKVTEANGSITSGKFIK